MLFCATAVLIWCHALAVETCSGEWSFAMTLSKWSLYIYTYIRDSFDYFPAWLQAAQCTSFAAFSIPSIRIARK